MSQGELRSGRAGGDFVAGDPVAAMAQEDMRIGRLARSAFVVVAVLIAGVGGWAMTTRISGAVIAPAKVVVEARAKTIQHLEGGIVSEIAVRDGARVAAGDVLVRLDDRRVAERIRGLEAEARAKAQQLASIEAELDDLRPLEAKRLVPRKRITEIERAKSGLEGEIGRLASELARARSEADRLVLRAPMAGRVHQLAIHTVGGVIQPGQEVLTIVPSDAALVLEARVDPASVDQIHEGQTASVRLTSFNQRTTPELTGRVVNVSADLVADTRGETFHYLARIALARDEVARLGDKALIPGMPAEVFIQSQSRSVASYLIKPLSDQWEKALREE